MGVLYSIKLKFNRILKSLKGNIENLNNPITIKENKSSVNLSIKKAPGLNVFTGMSYWTFKEKTTQPYTNTSRK